MTKADFVAVVGESKAPSIWAPPFARASAHLCTSGCLFPLVKIKGNSILMIKIKHQRAPVLSIVVFTSMPQSTLSQLFCLLTPATLLNKKCASHISISLAVQSFCVMHVLFPTLPAFSFSKSRHESPLIQIQSSLLEVQKRRISLQTATCKHTPVHTHTCPQGLVSFDLDLSQS